MFTLKMTSVYSALSGLTIQLTGDYGTSLLHAIRIGMELTLHGEAFNFRLYREGEYMVYLQFKGGELINMSTID